MMARRGGRAATGLGAAAAVLGDCLTAGVAPAADGSPAGADGVVQGQSDAGEILAQVGVWQREGLSAVDMNRRLQRHHLRIDSPRQYDEVETARRTMAARSYATDIEMMTPVIIRDDDSSAWYWMVSYRWRNQSFEEDVDCAFYRSCDLPGADAFGIVLDRKIYHAKEWARFSHHYASLGADYVTTPADRSAYGVVFKKQDTVKGNVEPEDLDMYYGTIAIVTNRRPCGSTRVWAKYAHTWKSTTVEPSLGVSFEGGKPSPTISYAFSESSNRWTVVSPENHTYRKC